jgi:cation diffusion facilitator CzcD-associated flavoprotein CzcO
MSRDWYPTFSLPNVSLETAAITELTERGVRTVDGAEHRVDTVIYGTGFKAADYLASLHVYGAGGRQLREDWSGGAEAYLGTLIAGYPNFFTLYGPNTNGVNSILYIHEAQTTFVRHILDVMGARGARTVEVTPAAQRRYNDEIQAAMAGKVWLACTNYFRHPSGKVVTQLPYSGRTFYERTRELVDGDYRFGR